MEKLVEAEKESSDSDNSDDDANISKIFKNSDVHRSSERNNYKSHFQLSPKESKNNDDEDKESETPSQKHINKTKRRLRRVKAGDVHQQTRTKFFDEEMLVLHYSIWLTILNKKTDALKAVTEYLQKRGISELSKGNLLKTRAVLAIMQKQGDIMQAIKDLKQAGACFYSVGCKKGLALCKFALAKIYYE